MRFVALSAAALLAACASSGPRLGGTAFAEIDADADGVISQSEFDGESALFDKVDRNGDDVLSEQEVAEHASANRPKVNRDRYRNTGSRL